MNTRISSSAPKASMAHHSTPTSRVFSVTPMAQAVIIGTSQCGSVLPSPRRGCPRSSHSHPTAASPATAKATRVPRSKLNANTAPGRFRFHTRSCVSTSGVRA